MREVAIVAFAQTPSVASSDLDEAEMVQVVTQDALNQLGITQRDIGFTCSGSCDMLIGRPFSFVSALDGLAV